MVFVSLLELLTITKAPGLHPGDPADTIDGLSPYLRGQRPNWGRDYPIRFRTGPPARRGVAGRCDGNLQEFVQRLGKIPLLYQPGTKWHYSVSTDVLGRLVEAVSGRPFDEFLAERIFRPLGMADTGFYVPADKLDRFAVNYGPKLIGGLKIVDAPATSRFAKDPKFFSGGGGLVSTAADYIRFCLMLSGKGTLAGKRLLKAETIVYEAIVEEK